MPFSPSSPVGHGAMRRELQGERGPLAESRPKPNPRNHTDAFPPSQVILPGRALSGCPSPLPHSLRWPRPLAIAKPAKSPGENNRGGRPEARNTKPRMHGAAPLGCNRTHGAEARGFFALVSARVMEGGPPQWGPSMPFSPDQLPTYARTALVSQAEQQGTSKAQTNVFRCTTYIRMQCRRFLLVQARAIY